MSPSLSHTTHKLKPPDSGGYCAVVPPFLSPRPRASLLHNCASLPHQQLTAPFFPAPFLGPFSRPPITLPHVSVPSLNLPGGQVHRLLLTRHPRCHLRWSNLSQGEVSLPSSPIPSFLSPAMTTDLPSLGQLSFPFPPDTETSPCSISRPSSLRVLSLAHFPPQSLFATVSCPSCPCLSWLSRTSLGPRPLPSSVVTLVACPCHLHC